MLFYVKRILISLVIITTVLSSTAIAREGDKIRLASVAWTGVTIKTELAVSILKSLGYKAENVVLSVPFAYAALSGGEVDVFLGNWMPSMATIANKFFKNGSVVQYGVNMPGAKYTLAVPTYCAEGGLRHFEDLVKFGDKLEWKIYGIEAGNDGNLIIRDMIKKNMFGLGKFKMLPSSEVAMLAEVQAKVKQNRWIVFLGWSPHSMNERGDMTYLKGSTAETFGPDDGTATVWTNVRKGFEQDQPNAARLFKNLTFDVSEMNAIMTVLFKDKSLKPRQAALKWVKANPEKYKAWLEGVTTLEGQPAVPAFEAYLKKHS
jgi:glycine betaine/proline transport system substrate-binding protein